MAKQYDPYQAQDDVVNEEINDSGAVAQSNTSEDINTDADASASEEICTTSMAWLLIIVMGQWSCTEKTCLNNYRYNWRRECCAAAH